MYKRKWINIHFNVIYIYGAVQLVQHKKGDFYQILKEIGTPVQFTVF